MIEPEAGPFAEGVADLAIVIRPTTGIRRQPAIASASRGISRGDQPCFDASPEVLTWRQTAGGSEISPASASSVWSSLSESTAWIIRTTGSVFLALFPCRWPIRCQRTRASASASAFFQSSCG
jgi:hypothetical protein